MNKYEVLLIFKPNFEAESMDGALQKVQAAVEAQGGSVLRTDRFGRKKLAYRIEKVREGLMAVVAIQLAADKVKDLSFVLKLNEDLLRFTLLRNDALDLEKPFVVTPVTGKEPREPRTGRRPMGGGGRFGHRGPRSASQEDGNEGTGGGDSGSSRSSMGGERRERPYVRRDSAPAPAVSSGE